MSTPYRVIIGAIVLLAVIGTADLAHASCSDNIQNGTETGVDCGGPCLACNGTACAANTDCRSGSCVDNVCAVVFSLAASPGMTSAQPGTTVAIDPGLTITGSGNLTGARILIASGYVSAQDTLAFTTQSGITGSWASATGILTLSGTATVAQYQAALRTVTYRNSNTSSPNTGDRVITFSLGNNGLALQTNGHFYEYITGVHSWTSARDLATARRYFGLTGYLVTVTTAAENAFVLSKLAGQGWIGAADDAIERTWRWVTGPEGLESSGAGRHFFNQGNPSGGSSTKELTALGADKPCSVPTECDSGVCTGNLCYHYNAWSSGEPNQYQGTNEDYGHYYTTGLWNDYAVGNTSINGYVVEYGGLPDDPPVVLQDNKTVRTISVSCSNGQKDGTETDIDCGGSCAPCTAGKGCGLDNDCTSLVCDGGICQNPTCSDETRNGSETDIDCGGSCAEDCVVGQGCNAAADCASGKCTLNICQAPTCDDSARNGDETDVDCGGSCADCANGNSCLGNADCVSGICNNNVCQSAACTDGVKNGTETDVDCGGSCAACPDTFDCAVANDCQSRVCTGLVCQAPTCGDGVMNGGETGTDCGGSCAATCPVGGGCASGVDCTTGVCTTGICQAATCGDGVTNGAETGIDCGGPTCADCGAGQGCAAVGDCLSRVCTGNVCQAPSCSDGLKNGDETDIDCGGYCGPSCDTNEVCAVGNDCSSLRCVALRCAAPTCSDGVMNQGETDIDCGGPTACARCANTRICTSDTDCESEICSGTCLAPSCSDERHNGLETDIDCGGGCPETCAYGDGCGVSGDCETGFCSGTLCGCPDGETIGSDGISCIGLGECDTQMTCVDGASDLVFYGVVSDGSGPAGSIRCVKWALSGQVTCDTDPQSGKLVVSPVLWCE